MNDSNSISSKQLLVKVNEYISQSIDLEQILPNILYKLKQYLNCEQVFICHFNSEGQEEIINHRGYQSDLDKLSNNSINNFLGAKRLINLNQDREASSQTIENIAYTQPVLKAELSLPIVIQIPEILVFLPNKVWGILFAYDYDESRVWTREEIINIEQIAQQIVLVVERELLYEQLQLKNQELQEYEVLDDVTQLANYQSFIDCLEFEWLRLAREKQPLSLIIITVSLFNDLNHNLEVILREIAEVLREVVQRPSDLSSRYAREKLAVILPNTNSQGGVVVANKIKNALPSNLINNQDISIEILVTTNVAQPNSDPNTILELIENTSTKVIVRGINIYVVEDNETKCIETRKEL